MSAHRIVRTGRRADGTVPGSHWRDAQPPYVIRDKISLLFPKICGTQTSPPIHDPHLPSGLPGGEAGTGKGLGGRDAYSTSYLTIQNGRHNTKALYRLEQRSPTCRTSQTTGGLWATSWRPLLSDVGASPGGKSSLSLSLLRQYCTVVKGVDCHWPCDQLPVEEQLILGETRWPRREPGTSCQVREALVFKTNQKKQTQEVAAISLLYTHLLIRLF